MFGKCSWVSDTRCVPAHLEEVGDRAEEREVEQGRQRHRHTRQRDARTEHPAVLVRYSR